MQRAHLRQVVKTRLRQRWAGLVAAVCLIVALAATSAGQAQEGAESEPPAATDTPGPKKPPPSEAVKHYEKGRALYLAGRYREAVVELEEALTLDPESPNLVYNLARVYELLGEIDRSIAQYKRYRDLLPASEQEEIARVEGTLQRLEGARDEVEEPTVVTVTSPPPPPPAPRERGVADAAFWSLATAAVGAFAAAAVTGTMARSAEHDARHFVLVDDGSYDTWRQKVHRANRLALGCDISLLAGAVLGTTAILLFALREKPVKPPPRASLEFGASRTGGYLLLKGHL